MQYYASISPRYSQHTEEENHTYNHNNRSPLNQLARGAKTLLYNPDTGMDVQRSQYIIQDQDLSLRIHSSRKRDSSFLSTTER
jgi:hypothetical protein